MAAKDSSTKILASAFSALLNTPVLTYDQYEREKTKKDGHCFTELTIPQLFGISNPTGPVGDVRSRLTTDSLLFVKTITGKTLTIPFSCDESVLSLKHKIEQREGVPVNSQRLVFCVKDLEDDRLLRDYQIQNGANLMLLLRVRGGGNVKQMLYMRDEFLDPGYDYDFTSLKDDGTVFYRGGKRYRRPYGWKRFALKVRGHYEDDVWLGESGHRTKSSPGEWPVSYHGTSPKNGSSIVKDGYDLSKGERFLYGVGVYSSPCLETIARRYAQTFVCEGKKYEFMLQNRVSPKDLVVVSASTTGAGEYWVQPHDSLVRPYGILYRRK